MKYTGHIIEHLPGEQSVLAGRDQRLHLPGRSAYQYRQVGVPQLPILPVCPPVVTERVVIERAADHLAPMAIIRGDGVADHVRLGLADDPHAARVDDILQDTGTGVVAGEYKHTVERHFRLLGFRLFPSQGIEGGHLFLIPFHLLRHGRPDLVVDRLHEHSRPREHAFSGGGGSDDEGLQTGEEPFASI